MPETPDQVPSSLIAGDTWVWQRALSDYPAGTWTATWHFEKKGSAFSVSAGVSGTTHTATVAAATTATYRPGRYNWSLRVSAAGESYVVERGQLVVEVDPAAAGSYDGRSTAEKVVEHLEALALKRSISGQTSVSIDGVSMTFDSMADVIRSLNFWRQELAAEQKAAGVIPGGRRTFRVRFGRP